jgi:hypothetical protein
MELLIDKPYYRKLTECGNSEPTWGGSCCCCSVHFQEKMDCELCNDSFEETHICSLPCAHHLSHYCIIKCLVKRGADTFCCSCGHPCNYICSSLRAHEVVIETRTTPWTLEQGLLKYHIVDSFHSFMDNLYSLDKK